MIILFGGSSSLACAHTADKAIKGLEKWRHFATEDLEGFGATPAMGDFGEMMLVELVRSTIEEMEKDGYHMIVSLPDAMHLCLEIAEDMDTDFATVYMGKAPKGHTFDHVLDTAKKSMKDVTLFLRDLVSQAV